MTSVNPVISFPAEQSVAGRIVRINGPIVQAQGLNNPMMLEVVRVGAEQLVGEIVRIENTLVTIQVYENTVGLRTGDVVTGTKRLLSVDLGPGMLGNIFDGFQRPLVEIAKQSGYTLRRGITVDPLNPVTRWPFRPTAIEGKQITSGDCFGIVQETNTLTHSLMVPWGIAGTVVSIVPEGTYCCNDVICILQSGSANYPLTMSSPWPVRKPRPIRERLPMHAPLITGQRVIDCLFPIAEGGTASVPGGFGTGKTIIEHSLAKWAAADVIVYIGCGERGNEMTEVLQQFPKLRDPQSGQSLLQRTVLIANTSNMPVAAREVSIYTGITIAEYFRDMGYRVALMADSTSRWAEALRELSSRLEEMPADEGFPAYLPTRLADFYERAGLVTTLGGKKGSVTIIGTVSPPGGDFSEPVTQHTARFVRCVWALDRDLANARHYPAVSWLLSYSDYSADIKAWWNTFDRNWDEQRNALMKILQQETKLERIAKLVGPDALPEQERLILFLAETIKNSFLQQSAYDDVDMFCSPEKQVAMLRILTSLAVRAEEFIKKGGTLGQIRALKIIHDIIRMKTGYRNDQLIELGSLHQALQDEFDRLNEAL